MGSAGEHTRMMADVPGMRLLSARLREKADEVAEVVTAVDRVPPPTVDDYGSQLVVDKMGQVLRTWSTELTELREAIDQLSRKVELSAGEVEGVDRDIADELRPSELGLPEGRWLPPLAPDQGGEPSPSEPEPPGGRWLPPLDPD